MDASFWHERWQNNEIGFHQDVATPLLKTHWNTTFGRAATVLVPMCGKSRDLLWLAERGVNVIGVELSEIAVKDFFDENELDYDVSSGDMMECRSTASPITIYQGDFFELPEEILASCEAVFDRGSLIALPEEMRSAYVGMFSALLAPGSQVLLITLEHNSPKNPPFSLHEAEVLKLYGDHFVLQHLGEDDEEFRGQTARNVAYRLIKKSNSN